MQTGKHSRWRIAALVMTALLLIVGLSIWLPLHLLQRQLLLPRATRVAAVANWLPGYSGYFWETDHHLLSARPLSNVGGPSNGPSAWQMVEVDTTTGAETPLPALNQALNQVLPDSNWWRLSPDGKWLLVRSGGGSFKAIALDGSRTVTWPGRPSNEGYVLWLPDSRRWVEFCYENGWVRPLLHSLDAPDTEGALIAGPATWPLGITPAEHVLTVENSGNRTATLYDFDLRQARAHRTTVTFTSAAEIVEVEPSPDCRRIAFLTQSRRPSPLRAWLARFLPAFRTEDRTRYDLWVCRADGSDLRRIGNENDNEVAAVQWIPDGKRISFTCNDTLYTISPD